MSKSHPGAINGAATDAGTGVPYPEVCKMAARTRRNYNDEEIERGLVAMALHSANSTRAHAALKEQGLPISARTLYTWVHKTKTERYEQVRREVMPQIKEAAHAGHMGLVARAHELEHKFLHRIEEDLPEIPARDLPGGLRNVSTVSGIHSDKARDLRGDPVVVEHRSMGDLLRAMRQKGIQVDFDVEGIAEEDTRSLGKGG